MGVQFIVYYAMTKLYAPLGIYDATTYHGLLPQIRELQDDVMLIFIAANVMIGQWQPEYSIEPLPAIAPSRSNVVSVDLT
jgi:hypothetical protein